MPSPGHGLDPLPPIRDGLMILFLIGFRGTGKTTIGRHLAESLECPWWDSDQEIQRQTGSTIAEIFAARGESGFRELEQQIVADVIEQATSPATPAIVSLGGGSLLTEATRNLVRQQGHCVWLQASAACLVRRIQVSQSQTPRPALTELGLEQEVATLMGQRTPVYSDCADYRIDTEQLTLPECVDQIVEWWRGVDKVR